ncbi:hypothetical protein C7X25_23410 [Salmonella enterica subsp. enterica serovar Sandiego]|nr:hypothetical protein [Salmonella enterica subsp. enterica]EEE4266968.1 hypothetical protein [Salmonella enterica subsp. enterica serovar Sandiego]
MASLITRYFSQQISDEEKVAALNHFRKTLHELSPFNRSNHSPAPQTSAPPHRHTAD